MDRRTFTWSLGAGLVALGARHPHLRQGPPLVDGTRLNRTLTELARFGRTEAGGISRVAYGDDDLAARRYVSGLMENAGLRVEIDIVGNLIGRRDGAVASLPPLMFGSHIDSVPGGGNYDGQVGSMSAIEVARALHDVGIITRHPLELVIFQNEEGGKTGSRALSGEVRPAELDIVTASGYTIRDGITRLGGDPTRLAEAQRSPGAASAYFELHVEQGAVLDAEHIDIGVVEGIVGIKRWRVQVDGFANHAGTTPMNGRRDALLAAGRFIDAVHRTARRIPGRHVATVGQIEAVPGAPNVIAGEARLSLEIRDLAMDTIDRVFDAIRGDADAIAADTGTSFTFTQFYESRAAPTDERLRVVVERAAADLGLTAQRMPSGAGHDAQSVAQFAPVGMIFVPSVAGISHSPRELTRPADITNGANVLLRALLAADAGFE